MKIEEQESKYEVGDAVEYKQGRHGTITAIVPDEHCYFRYVIENRWLKESDIIYKMERVR